jgi:uncharacterized protein YebE (UPF0316 family)
MSTPVATTFVLIVVARITDVTLDTVRTAAIVQGRRVFAAILGFFEAVIYVTAIAKVLLNMDHPIYALAYGLGFAMGTFLGITIEQRLAFGLQVVSLFTRSGAELAKGLISAGYRVAKVQGQFRDGEASILYVEVLRKYTRKLVSDATAIDETCFCVVSDVRVAQYLKSTTNFKTSRA